MQALIALEERRCQALVTRDLADVESMLDPALLYVHSTGLINDKAALLDFLEHRIYYEAVERQGLSVHCQDDIAWMTGLMRLSGHRLPDAQVVASTTFVSQLWVCESGIWLLRGFQSTRVEDELWAT